VNRLTDSLMIKTVGDLRKALDAFGAKDSEQLIGRINMEEFSLAFITPVISRLDSANGLVLDLSHENAS
jgi:hypothetical protein